MMQKFYNISFISGGVELNGAVTFGIFASGLSFIPGLFNPISIPIFGAFALNLSNRYGEKLNKTDELILETGQHIFSLASEITLQEYKRVKEITISCFEQASTFIESIEVKK